MGAGTFDITHTKLPYIYARVYIYLNAVCQNVKMYSSIFFYVMCIQN